MRSTRLGRGRRSKSRPRGKRVLLVCNGKVTEPEYFRLLANELGIAALVRVPCSGAGKDPLTLVRAAAKIRDKDMAEADREGFDSYTSVWAITDVDQYLPGGAQREARRCSIRLALSNPCFEVWLIDHLCMCPESCAETKACQEAAIKRGAVSSVSPSRLSKSRMKAIRPELVRKCWQCAIENASHHNTEEKRRAREGNPNRVKDYAVWTDVPQVVTMMAELAANS